jgi:SpoVK/Ycf46/Vps4 family AAA+-type ATPase
MAESDVLPPGISAVSVLPDHDNHRDWTHLFLSEGLKQRLLNQAVFSLLHRRDLNTARVALQGLVVLMGPPGTGKTTAARGLANSAALALAKHGATTLIEVDPHALPSDLLGESQRNVARLFSETIPEYAARRPFTVVMVDEVEAFAVRRSSASFETNPADLHRATDAVLTGFDRLTEALPNVFFVVTTNFPDAVDEALISRADMVVPFSLPELEARHMIIRDTLDELGGRWNEIRALRDDERLLEVARRCEGLDGRRLRKLITTAFTYRDVTALDPSRLELEDLLEAAEEFQRNRIRIEI